MKMLWLLSGLGVGAGVTYLLDPDKGAGRRDRVRASVAAYGRQTGVLLDETGQSLGRQAQAVLATQRLPCRRPPEREERRRTQGETGACPGAARLGRIGGRPGLSAGTPGGTATARLAARHRAQLLAADRGGASQRRHRAHAASHASPAAADVPGTPA